MVTGINRLLVTLLLATALIGPLAQPTEAAEPHPPSVYSAGPADLDVSWEETRSIHARRLAWAWIKNVGAAPSDGIKVTTWCGYMTESGDVTERAAKPAAIMPALAPGERVLLNFDCNPWEGRTAIYGRVQATTASDENTANNAVKQPFD